MNAVSGAGIAATMCPAYNDKGRGDPAFVVYNLQQTYSPPLTSNNTLFASGTTVGNPSTFHICMPPR